MFCCAHGFYIVVIFLSTIVSFGSVPPEKYQSDGIPNLELLSQPSLDAISQAVVMAMENIHIVVRRKNENQISFMS